jgi:hypothetical protein
VVQENRYRCFRKECDGNFFGIERKSTPRRVAARAARGGLKIRRHCFGPGGGGSPLLTARVPLLDSEVIFARS